MYVYSRIYFADLITGKIHINHHQHSYNAMYHVVSSNREK